MLNTAPHNYLGLLSRKKMFCFFSAARCARSQTCRQTAAEAPAQRGAWRPAPDRRPPRGWLARGPEPAPPQAKPAGRQGRRARRPSGEKNQNKALSLSTYWRLGRARRRRSSPRSGTALPEGDPRLPPRSARAASDCCDRAVPPPPRVFFRPWTGRRSRDR